MASGTNVTLITFQPQGSPTQGHNHCANSLVLSADAAEVDRKDGESTFFLPAVSAFAESFATQALNLGWSEGL